MCLNAPSVRCKTHAISSTMSLPRQDARCDTASLTSTSMCVPSAGWLVAGSTALHHSRCDRSAWCLLRQLAITAQEAAISEAYRARLAAAAAVAQPVPSSAYPGVAAMASLPTPAHTVPGAAAKSVTAPAPSAPAATTPMVGYSPAKTDGKALL